MLRPRKAVLAIGLFGILLSQMAMAAEYKPGEVIVKYKDGAIRTRSEMNTLYDSIRVDHVRHYNGLIKGFDHLILDEGVDVQKAIEDLRKDEKVDYAQPNYILRALPIEEDRMIQPAIDFARRGVPC